MYHSNRDDNSVMFDDIGVDKLDTTKKKAYETVIDYIERDYAEGKLKMGDKLPSERELAEQLHVSRASVREGLRQLEQRGVVEIKHGIGSFIALSQASLLANELSESILDTDRHFIYDMLEFRLALEAEAAYLAAQRANSVDLGKMKDSLEKMAASKDDIELGIQADVAFHVAIVEATNNAVFINLIKSLMDHMEDTIRVTRTHRLANPVKYQATLNEHKEIYISIATKNKHRARELMKKHIFQIRMELSESMLEERDF